MTRVIRTIISSGLICIAATTADAARFNPYFQQGYNEAVERQHRVQAEKQRLQAGEGTAYSPTELRDRLGRDCIRNYEAAQPKKHSTRCYGSASPDGDMVNGYTNCETEEQRVSAPRSVVEQCYRDARDAVGM